jgi:hypothetical protein
MGLALVVLQSAIHFPIRGFDSVGWEIMKVITVATFLAIGSRMIPRRTR